MLTIQETQIKDSGLLYLKRGHSEKTKPQLMS